MSIKIYTKDREMYDFLIIGSGLFGATFAQQAIADKKKVLILEKREHIAGNCYTKNINNINVHYYGPHIFHTSSDRIWEYVNRFTTFNHYVNRPKVNYQNKIFSFPINLFTLYQLWGVSTPDEAKAKLDTVKIDIKKPSNLEEWVLSQVGEEIYETFIKGYTTKQWNTDPKNLPSAIIRRLPIRLTYDDNYFFDNYQGIPVGGYTKMIENMMEGADVIIGEDYFANKDKWDSQAKCVVFTGRIDEFFDFYHGALDYRSLRFETSILDKKDFQGNAIVNYTEREVPYTRIIEHKHFEFSKEDTTVISKEYPQDFSVENSIPYYPINTEPNNNLYRIYKDLSKGISNKFIFGGRLAEYKYYDMHQVIGSSLNQYDKIRF